MRPSLLSTMVGGLVLAAVVGQSLTFAQSVGMAGTPTLPPAEQFAGPWPREILTAQQVEKLVGPIALYPDPLLAQVLPASTYPLDIVKAARLINSGADEAAMAASGVDASVQALARYPEVLAMMDQHLEWTERLGQAFVEQPDDVMVSVQRLRAIARAYGNLATTPQQEVVVEQEAIRIVPVTEYVYVPYYEPTVVYYQRCPTTYSYVRFNSCSWIGSWYDLDCDWHRRTLCRRGGWSWRDYCYRRAYTGVSIRFNYYDDNNCERPVDDWRRDPHRHRHWSDRRGGNQDDDRRDRDGRRDGNDGRDSDDRRDGDGRRGDRPPPRSAAPNPPRVNAPPPSAPPTDRPPRNDRPPREREQPDGRPAQPEPDRPSSRPDTPARPPQAPPTPPPPIVKSPKAAPAPPRVAPPSVTPPATTPTPRDEQPTTKPRLRPSKPVIKPDGGRSAPKPDMAPAPSPKPALPKANPPVEAKPKPAIKTDQPESRPVTRAPKAAEPAPRPEPRPPAAPRVQPPRVEPARPATKPESRPSPPRQAPVARPTSKPESAPAAERKAPARPNAESPRNTQTTKPTQDRPPKNR